QNTVQRMLEKDAKLMIGGYGQIDYNQEINSHTNYNGNMDVHRLVLLFGYKFNSKTSFFSEIELEHVKEVYVEQAFLHHKINDWLNFKAGLMLIPIGFINEYHEPPLYNGVERPNVDKYVVPTTWREIGIGFSGKIKEYSFKYQLYLTNGFLGYDGNAKFDGKTGLRGGRQKGAKSVFSSPNITGRIDYFAVPGLKLGLSGYFGNSQSTAYDGIGKNDEILQQSADSTVVGISMFGIDAQYNIKGFGFRGQFNLSQQSNTLEYNQFTGSNLGSKIMGFYLEVSYNAFQSFQTKHQLIPFVRYENYNTHASVEEGIIIEDAYAREEFIFGLGWKMHKGAVLKADYQILNEGSNSQRNFFNMGVGVMF
ncbi:MAG: hypothetical protein DRJ07_18675, partial [Bacteroidetes bacterium]